MADLSYDETTVRDNRSCAICGTVLVRPYGESLQRWIARRYCGTACTGASRRRDLVARFLEKVDDAPGHGPNGNCHEWTGAKSRSGYGVVQVDGKAMAAHRAAWELRHRTSIPDGMMVMHSCDHRSCVNPDHLSVGTASDNMQDKVSKGRCNARRGSASHMARINEADAIKIYLDPRGSEVIAQEYPISGAMVLRIKQGKAWQHATAMLRDMAAP